MTTDPNNKEAEAGESPRPISWPRIWGEVAGVWAIALAHPIYVKIASGPEALTSFGVRRADLVVLIAIVSLLGPLLISLAELAIRRLTGERPRQVVHGLVIGSLLSLVVWQWLLDSGSPAIVHNLIPFALALLVAWLYVKTELVRNFALILSFATVVVIVSFCIDYPIENEVFPHEAAASTPKIESDTPVVMVIFDELPLAALERPDGKVDPRFRNFSRLAGKATWYPGALTLADQTTRAVPSILSGQDPYPKPGWDPPPPGLPDYPDSVCRIASDGGYQVKSYEPVTDLCEQTWGLGKRVTATIRRAVGASDSPDTIAPFGLDQKAAALLNLPYGMPWSEYSGDRPEAVDHFVNGLTDSDRTLSVLHIALPHISWMYSPDGSSYENLRPTGDSMLSSPGTEGQLDRDAQQMMLQLQYTDRVLGEVIDRMKELGTWDDSLFIVTADHGAGFNPGASRRLVNLANLGWIAPVPLFIKYPGQEKGKVVRGTVDGRDLAPTILGQLGVEPENELNGRDLQGRSSLPQLRQHDISNALGGLLRADVSRIREQQRQAEKFMHQRFGRSFFAPGGHAGLLGRKPAGLTEIPAEPTDPSLYADVDPDSGQIPTYYEARLSPESAAGRAVAVSLNGRIVATAKPWQAFGAWFVGVNLPTGDFRPGNNDIRVYEIRAGR